MAQPWARGCAKVGAWGCKPLVWGHGQGCTHAHGDADTPLDGPGQCGHRGRDRQMDSWTLRLAVPLPPPQCIGTARPCSVAPTGAPKAVLGDKAPSSLPWVLGEGTGDGGCRVDLHPLSQTQAEAGSQHSQAPSSPFEELPQAGWPCQSPLSLPGVLLATLCLSFPSVLVGGHAATVSLS